MRSPLLFVASICVSLVANGQNVDRDQVIELGKYYSNYIFMSEPPRSAQKELDDGFDLKLKGSIVFIKEASLSKNKLLTKDFLTLPDSLTLKIIYIVDALHQNPHKVNVQEPGALVDSLLATDVPLHELIDEYYSTLFTAVGNKNKPFDLSKVDFRLKEYNLGSDRAKGIFYLQCMEMCGSQIFGYMNVVDPPNTKTALEYIRKFPKFNGSEYFRYTDLYFEDFEMEIYNDKGIQSYKDTYIDKLYTTLLSHLICMNKESVDQEKINELLLASILKDSTVQAHNTSGSLGENLSETINDRSQVL